MTIRIEYTDGKTEDVCCNSMVQSAGAVSFHTLGGELVVSLHNIRRYYHVRDNRSQSAEAAQTEKNR